MGLIDKNYLNRLNQKIQNDLSKQPCGCDCNCRPKFENDEIPGPTPGCNCDLRTNYFVGDWSTGQSPLNTGQINLQVSNGWNCPFQMSFRWVNVSFSNPLGIGVLFVSTSVVINMSDSIWYTVTLQPGDFIQFDFGGFSDSFDQTLNIQAKNATCAVNYGVVGSFTLTAI
jgi:hypothetical protein